MSAYRPDPVLPSGLFAGVRVSRAPAKYLELLLGSSATSDYLCDAIHAELTHRTEVARQREGDATVQAAVFALQQLLQRAGERPERNTEAGIDAVVDRLDLAEMVQAARRLGIHGATSKRAIRQRLLDQAKARAQQRPPVAGHPDTRRPA